MFVYSLSQARNLLPKMGGRCLQNASYSSKVFGGELRFLLTVIVLLEAQGRSAPFGCRKEMLKAETVDLCLLQDAS